jgi:hypothetical protein
MKLRLVKPVALGRIQKSKQRVRGMQQDVDLVMAARFQPKQLDIQGVRHRGQRVPIVEIGVKHRPLDHGEIQDTLDVQVLRHVAVVIEVNERITMDGIIDCKGRNEQQKAESPHPSSRRKSPAPALGLRLL